MSFLGGEGEGVQSVVTGSLCLVMRYTGTISTLTLDIWDNTGTIPGQDRDKTGQDRGNADNKDTQTFLINLEVN